MYLAVNVNSLTLPYIIVVNNFQALFNGKGVGVGVGVEEGMLRVGIGITRDTKKGRNSGKMEVLVPHLPILLKFLLHRCAHYQRK